MTKKPLMMHTTMEEINGANLMKESCSPMSIIYIGKKKKKVKKERSAGFEPGGIPLSLENIPLSHTDGAVRSEKSLFIGTAFASKNVSNQVFDVKYEKIRQHRRRYICARVLFTLYH